MTIEQLIEQLRQFDPKRPVMVGIPVDLTAGPYDVDEVTVATDGGREPVYIVTSIQ